MKYVIGALQMLVLNTFAFQMRRDKVNQFLKHLQYLTIPSQKKEGHLLRKVSFSYAYNQCVTLHSECVISNGLVYHTEDAQ